MSPILQSIIALALVAGAVIYFVRGWWIKRNNPGCGGGCGCSGPANSLKKRKDANP